MALSAGGIRAGQAYVEVGANTLSLERGLRFAQAKVQAFAAGVRNFGSQLLGAGITSGIPMFLGLQAFAEFDQAMARVKAVTRGITDQEFKMLQTEAKRLGLVTAYSAKQAAQGMGVLALAGLRPAEVMQAMGAVLDLTAAAQIDVAQAADIALKSMKGMGFQAWELRSVLDVLGMAMTTANTDLVMLGEAFRFVGPLAKNAGVSLAEITAGIQMLSDAGIQGEMAGTTLRGMLLALTSPSAEASAELKRLKVEVMDSKRNFRGLVAIVTDLEKALQGVGTGDKLKSLGTIFPARQATGAAELISQGGAKFAEMTKALGGATGTTAAIAATQLNTLKGSIELVMSSIEGLALAAGQILAPSLRSIGDVAMNLTNSISTFIEQNPELVKSIATVTASITGAGAALIATSLALKLGSYLFNPWVVGFAGIATAAYILTKNLEVWTTLADTVTETAGIMYNALANNDLGGAMRVAWLGAQLAGYQAYQGLAAGAVETWHKIAASLGMVMNDAFGALQVAWAKVMAFIGLGSYDVVDQIRKDTEELNKFITEDTNRKIKADRDARADAIQGIKDQIQAEKELQQFERDKQKVMDDMEREIARGMQLQQGLAAKMPDVTRGIDAATKTDVAGTFSSAVANLLGGKSGMDKVAAGVDGVHQEIKGLRRDVQDGGGKFA